MISDPIDRSTIVHALVNDAMQAVGAALRRQGCRGGLRDSRALRAALSETVSENVNSMSNSECERLLLSVVHATPGQVSLLHQKRHP